MSSCEGRERERRREEEGGGWEGDSFSVYFYPFSFSVADSLQCSFMRLLTRLEGGGRRRGEGRGGGRGWKSDGCPPPLHPLVSLCRTRESEWDE